MNTDDKGVIPMNTSEPFYILLPESGMKHGEAAYLLHEGGYSYKNVEYRDVKRPDDPVDALVVLDRTAAYVIAMMQFPDCVLIHVDANGMAYFAHPFGAKSDQQLGKLYRDNAIDLHDYAFGGPVMGVLFDKQTGFKHVLPSPTDERIQKFIEDEKGY